MLLYPTQYKLGKTLIILTFALQYWFKARGDAVLSVEEAMEEAMRQVENAIQIFKEVSKVLFLCVHCLPIKVVMLRDA